MPTVAKQFIYDDDGEPMKPGSLVLVNGTEERVINFDRRGEIRIQDWPDDEMIFSVERVDRDDQRDERVITIRMDGGSWLCYDERFVNLAESEYYGFGDTPEDALAEYLATEHKKTGSHSHTAAGLR